MVQMSEGFIGLLPLSREQKALKVFAITGRVFGVDSDYHILPAVAEYRRQIEPITGLSKKVLVARAIFDLNEPDGMLLMATKKAGKNRPFASFFEYLIKGKTSKLILLGVCLNLDVSIKHPGGTDSFSVVDALVEAEAEIENRRKKGEDKLILRRSQVDVPIREFLEPSGRVIS